jgi:hypothetical protein
LERYLFGLKQTEAAVLFVNKKNQKNFFYLDRDIENTRGPD